jgi:hypothetical protein
MWFAQRERIIGTMNAYRTSLNEAIAARRRRVRGKVESLGVLSVLFSAAVPAQAQTVGTIDGLESIDPAAAYGALQTLVIATYFMPLLMSIGIYRSLRLAHRWWVEPDTRPDGDWNTVWRFVSRAIGYLVVAITCFEVVPQLTGVPLSDHIRATPYFGYALLISGVIGLVWAIVWPQIAIFVLRPGRYPALIVSSSIRSDDVDVHTP